MLPLLSNPNLDNSDSYLTIENFEQPAEIESTMYFDSDIYFYRFWWLEGTIKSKFFKKIWTSLKLKKPILNELLSISVEQEACIPNFYFLYPTLDTKKRAKFLNWWGWVWILWCKFYNCRFERLLYYKYWYFCQFFYWLKWLKSTDKRLEIKIFNNFYFFSQNTKFYLQTSFKDQTATKLRKYSRTLPSTKLAYYISSIKDIHVDFNFYEKTQLINFQLLFLLNNYFLTFKLKNFFFDRFSFSLTTFGLLLEDLQEQPLSFILSFLYLLFNQTNTFNFIYIFIFYMKDFFLADEFHTETSYFFSQNVLVIPRLNELVFNSAKTICAIWGQERFIKSYIFNANYKYWVFNWFFTNYFKKKDMEFLTTNLETSAFNSVSLENFRNYPARKIYKFFTFKAQAVLNYVDTAVYNNFNLIVDDYTFDTLENTNFISYDRYKLLYFDVLKINWFILKMPPSVEFSLEPILNFSLVYNKYFKFDVYSSLITNLFFNVFTAFNSIFFFWWLYTRLFTNFTRTSIVLLGFELRFFKKKFIYWMNIWIVKLFCNGFTTFIKTLTHLNVSHFETLLQEWIPTFWFWPSIFTEELIHLAGEFMNADFEWLREILWVKQLAELWLVKLTDYLKTLWAKNIDLGNIQYSPDFTQQHEFALILKWGLELEFLWWTWLIVEKRYFGANKRALQSNLILWKINFIYNAKKPRYSKEFLNSWLTVYRPYLVLSLASVYELTRLTLATVISSYWFYHKLKRRQLDTIHYSLPNTINETRKGNIYDFLFFIHDRHFLLSSYKSYYLKTGIKKQIRFWKMKWKKVFQRFINRFNLFFEIENFWNSFNFFMFKFFWKMKWSLKKIFYHDPMYDFLHWIIFKWYRALTFPNFLTADDSWFLNLLNLKVTATLPIKNFFFLKKYFSMGEFGTNNLYIFYISKLYLYEMHILKPLISTSNLQVNLVCNSLTNSKFFFLKTSKKNLEIESENKHILTWLTSVFENFFSEFFYDQFTNFFVNLNLLKSNKFKNAKNIEGNFYSTLSSDNFSTSFYSFLNKQQISFKHFNCANFIKFFFVRFEKFILTEFYFDLFYKNLLLFWFTSSRFKFLSKKINNFTKSYNMNFSLLLSFEFILNTFISSNSFWKSLVKTFVYWFLQFYKDQKFDFFLKKVFYQKNWINEFSSNLEILFLNFLVQFFSYLIRK